VSGNALFKAFVYLKGGCAAGIVTGAKVLSLDGKTDVETKDHADALTQMLAALATAGITLDKLTAAAHRVVHGGTILTAPARVTPQVIAAIESVIPLAQHGRRFRR